MTYEFTDRYAALGIPCPPPGLCCKGYCEGTGWVPVKKGGAAWSDPDEPVYRALWEAAERDSPNPPGDLWHFVPCPDCNGTGIDGSPSDEQHYRGDR